MNGNSSTGHSTRIGPHPTGPGSSRRRLMIPIRMFRTSQPPFYGRFYWNVHGQRGRPRITLGPGWCWYNLLLYFYFSIQDFIRLDSLVGTCCSNQDLSQSAWNALKVLANVAHWSSPHVEASGWSAYPWTCPAPPWKGSGGEWPTCTMLQDGTTRPFKKGKENMNACQSYDVSDIIGGFRGTEFLEFQVRC